ncbi:MAG: GNAT family N-acetyltransferase [Provencibacterium sp.]|nr:GNAT family N-acetyltransferase [Provencibacterium sp.]
MVILIGGASHAGKTLLAQRLLERYRYPYTSIDHLKMGLIRANPACGFTAQDSDEKISRHLWGILKGMIDTCLENGQNLILEGCYLPPEKVMEIAGTQVIAVYLLLSREYITRHFSDMLRYESIIEQRGEPDERGMQTFIKANERLKAACRAAGAPWFEISENYAKEMQALYHYLDEKICAALKEENREGEEARVRLASAQDAGQLLRLNEQFNGENEVSLEEMQRSLSFNRQEIVIVAQEKGMLVGFTCLQIKNSCCYSKASAEITEVFVSEKHRRKGYARSMLEFAEQYGIQQGIHHFTLLTGKENRKAQALYRSLGYREEDELLLAKER